jgi:hypothetical protein
VYFDADLLDYLFESVVGGQYWKTGKVTLGTIYFRHDEARRFTPIFVGTHAVVLSKWRDIEKAAKSYPFGELQTTEKALHWENSRYGWFDNNSNTFIRWIMKEVRLSGKLPGRHGGNKLPEAPPEFEANEEVAGYGPVVRKEQFLGKY